MASLTELLLATQNPEKCAEATAKIREAELNSVEHYFMALAQEIASDDKPVIARQLSGLLLKNGLFSKDPVQDVEKKARWKQLSEPTRNAVKEATTKALIAPEVDVGKAAAQVLAKIGSIEIPPGEWNGLVPLLLNHVTNTNPKARQISLTTFGYLCEELVNLQEEGNEIKDDISNSILTAVVQGMRDPEVATKLEATTAFYWAVVLAKRNFQNQIERDLIMKVVCENCTFEKSEHVQIAAFECLVQIATEYYEHLMLYMDFIGPLTWNTIRSAREKVGIPAMEFWSTICDEELFIQDLAADGQPSERPNLNLIQKALQCLVPLLTETLTRQEDEEDDDTWNLAMAAGTCLGLVAQVAQDHCVDLVIGFIKENFGNANWKYREAAVLAYGSIMEGPTSEKMRPLVMQSYGSLVGALQDPSVAVRDTIAWTLGRIAQFHPTIVPVKELTPVLGERLGDVPRVAANICWVIQVLAESQPGSNCGVGQLPDTTALSEFFTSLAAALLQATNRPDANDRQLRMSAYNSLSAVVGHAGNDCLVHMERLVQEMLVHLNQSFNQNVDRECKLQGYICGVLTSLVLRLREKILPVADQIMEQALKVTQAFMQLNGNAQALHEEALILISALANAIGVNFARFLSHFAPHLQVGLQNYDDVPVCLMATGIVGDLCRALEGQMLSCCEVILQILNQNLHNPNVDKKIRAAIIVCFGDLALAIKGDFEKYLPEVMKLLQDASLTTLQPALAKNEDWVEYLSNLRENVLESYSLIIHGLRDANKLHLFKEHVNGVLHFVKQISEDTTSSDAVMKAALAVVGDLVFVFQQELTRHLGNAAFLVRLVEYGQRCPDPSIQRTAAWMQSLLQKYSAGIQQ